MTIIKKKDGTEVNAVMLRFYKSFEGEVRYIFSHEGKEYRCIKDKDGRYIEK